MRDSEKNSNDPLISAARGSYLALDLFGQHNALPAREARPFLRWAGGKTRLLRFITPHVPARIRAYHEPFLGSGAVFFQMRFRVTRESYLADLNEELVNCWTLVRDDPSSLYEAARKYLGKDSEREYYRIREMPLPADPLARAARFLYLNQTAWNSLWRENKHGVFNVPWGARPFRGIEREEISAVSSALQGVIISKLDWRTSLERPKRGDFVYLDPPYLPVSDTSKFSGYNGTRFRADDLVELASRCEELSAKGVHWLLSNRDTPMVRKLFSHAKIVAFTTRRSVAAQNKRNVQPADSPEVLIVGRAQE